MNTSITSSVTDGQRKQAKRFAEDAVDRAIAEGILDKDGAQKLIEKGDDLQADIVASIRRLSVSNQFANEEVKSSYGYLSGYKPKSITEQTNRLRELFPCIGYANEQLAQQPVPQGAEGWFAIPRWQKIAPTYHEAVQKVLDLIKKTRNGKLYNYREGQIDQQHLRLSVKIARMIENIGEQQKDHDILVIPCQFGKLHAGRSVRRALEVMSAEFGLDPFSVGIMLLTHPERLQHYDDLWIDCAGAEFSDDGDGRFVRAPYFRFYDGWVRFGTHYVGYACGFYGSASGFPPQ